MLTNGISQKRKAQAIYEEFATLVAETVKILPVIQETGLIPELGRSPGEGNGNPLQYSCLENSMDRGAWWATVHGVPRVGHEWLTLSLSCSKDVSHYHLWFGIDSEAGRVVGKLDSGKKERLPVCLDWRHLTGRNWVCKVGEHLMQLVMHACSVTQSVSLFVTP